MIHRAQTSHIASNFSIIDLATVLYENLKPEDRVVWSKGWAAASIYYFGVQRGDIPAEAINLFPHPPYLGLAETTVPGVLVNGGSVGHGSPVATGIALAKKLKGEPGMVYCIMSDGELNEGSVWESVMCASHQKLSNLTFIVDMNGWQAMGKTEDVMKFDARAVFNAWGFNVYELDGHNHEQIEFAIQTGALASPTVILANTVKGKGLSFMENLLTFHYKNVTDDLYEAAIKEQV